MAVELYKNVATIKAKDAATWRKWLAENWDKQKSIWLIIYKKESGVASVYYNEAVDEALCYGWVDSSIGKRDAESYYQYFAKRNIKSNWSKVNKDKVAKLLAENKIAAPGQAIIDLAKQTGTWDALNDVEALILPNDLVDAFNNLKNREALDFFDGISKSAKRGILEWLFNAKQTSTRQARINEIVCKAALGKRALFDK
jgi:uncharacterized protein YdeI (YjbR/CyaY-like superfamily)